MLVDRVASDVGVAPGDVTVESSQAWTWPDASLGCPLKGYLYSQVVTDGYWVVLAAHGMTFDFRVTRDGAARLCDRPLPETGERAPKP